MAEETLVQKIKIPAISFKDEAKLQEAIEAFESEFLGDITRMGLSDDELKALPRGKQLIQQKIREFVQERVRAYRKKERDKLQSKEVEEDIFGA